MQGLEEPGSGFESMMPSHTPGVSSALPIQDCSESLSGRLTSPFDDTFSCVRLHIGRLSPPSHPLQHLE